MGVIGPARRLWDAQLGRQWAHRPPCGPARAPLDSTAERGQRKPQVRRPPQPWRLREAGEGRGPHASRRCQGREWGRIGGGGAWLHRTLQCGGGNRFPFVLFAGTVGTAGVAHCALTLETPYLTLGLGPCQQGPRMRCRGSTLLVWPGVETIVDSADSLSFTIAGYLPPMCIPRTVPITSSRKATPESTPRLLRVPIFPSG